MAAQSTSINGVTGATATSNAVKAALKSALGQATGAEPMKATLADGTYSVQAVGYSWTGMLNSDVTFRQGQLSGIEIAEEYETTTSEMANTAFTYIIPRLIENQSLAVNAISGATSTSDALKDCVSQAIMLAGGDPADWQTPEAKKSGVARLDGSDVAVVGLDGSGMMSYCTAADAGAVVFGIETSAKPGGKSATTTGPMVIGSKAAIFEGVDFANPDDVYQT